MVEYQNNLKKHSNYLKKIIDETNSSTGKNILAMINELSNSVTKDIDNIKNIIRKSPIKENRQGDVTKIKLYSNTARNIKLPTKEFMTENFNNRFIRTKKIPKEIILSFKDSQKEDTSEARTNKIKDKNSCNKENSCSTQNEALKSNSDTGYKTKLSHGISNSSYLSINHFSLEFMNSNQHIVTNPPTSINTEDFNKLKKETYALHNTISKISLQNEKFIKQIDTLSKKIKHYGELESFFNDKIVHLKNKQSNLKEKYKEKCREINLIEEKFEGISEKFNIILDGIKDHHKDIIDDNKNLKEILIYTLVCYNEKKFDFINFMIEFIKKNETFIDRSIFSNSHLRKSSFEQKKMVENLYSNDTMRGRLGQTVCDYSKLELITDRKILDKNVSFTNELKERSLSMSIYKKLRNSSYSVQRSNSLVSSKNSDILNKTSLYNLMNNKKLNLSSSNDIISRDAGFVNISETCSKTNFLKKNEIKVEDMFDGKRYNLDISKQIKRSYENTISDKNSEFNKGINTSQSISVKTMNRMNSVGVFKDSSFNVLKENDFGNNMIVKQLSKAKSQIIISRDLDELMKQKIDNYKPK